MAETYDVVIIGAGPGGIAAGILAQKADFSYVILEKGKRVLQGIIDSYPRGKRVYPTIPRGMSGPFPVAELTPPKEKVPVERYVDQMEAMAESLSLNIEFDELYQDLIEEDGRWLVKTEKSLYLGRHVIFAFGSNIPNDLGIYGESRTVARKIENPEDYIGINVLVIGGGNAAADVVASLSRIKREAKDDSTSVYWAHLTETFEINKDTARDLGEEILLGGHIKILQRAVPKIGEVDADGIDRLFIHQATSSSMGNDL